MCTENSSGGQLRVWHRIRLKSLQKELKSSLLKKSDFLYYCVLTVIFNCYCGIRVYILQFLCICVKIRYRDGSVDSVDNTVEENSSVFSLIQMHWLPSARACEQ